MKIAKLKKSIKNIKGFTIIESIISVFILTLSITGATSIVSSSLQNANLVKAQGQAVGLAVEGLEYARNIHDQALLGGSLFEAGNPFYDFTNDCVDGCELSPRLADSNGVVVEGGYSQCEENCFLNITDAGYVVSKVQDTNRVKYERQIRVDSKVIDGGTEFKVVTDVDYSVGAQAATISFDSFFFIADNPTVEEEG